jgi:hypothetical protein
MTGSGWFAPIAVLGSKTAPLGNPCKIGTLRYSPHVYPNQPPPIPPRQLPRAESLQHLRLEEAEIRHLSGPLLCQAHENGRSIPWGAVIFSAISLLIGYSLLGRIVDTSNTVGIVLINFGALCLGRAFYQRLRSKKIAARHTKLREEVGKYNAMVANAQTYLKLLNALQNGPQQTAIPLKALERLARVRDILVAALTVEGVLAENPNYRSPHKHTPLVPNKSLSTLADAREDAQEWQNILNTTTIKDVTEWEPIYQDSSAMEQRLKKFTTLSPSLAPKVPLQTSATRQASGNAEQ